MDIGGLISFSVDVGCDETDRNVEGLARNLVPVDEGAELCMDWYETKRAWAPTKLSPVVS